MIFAEDYISLITLYTRVGEKKQSGVEAAFEKNCRSSGRAEDSMNACPSRHERRKSALSPSPAIFLKRREKNRPHFPLSTFKITFSFIKGWSFSHDAKYVR